MHGTYEANNAMHDCDLMINIGARFDDRITGKIDEFSPKSKKIHIDIDPSSIGKNVKVDLAITSDVTYEMKRQGIEVPDDLTEKVCSHLCNMLGQEVSTERKDDGIDDDFRDMMPKSDEPEPFGYGR